MLSISNKPGDDDGGDGGGCVQLLAVQTSFYLPTRGFDEAATTP